MTDWIDHELHAVGLADAVVAIGRLGEVELVLKPGAATPFDRKPQDGRLGLLFRDQRDALCRGRGESKRVGHDSDLGRA